MFTKMSGFGVILFGLSGMLFQCSGKVNPPPGGTRLTFLNGSTAKIEWSYDGIKDLFALIWSFKRSDSGEEGIANIIGDKPLEILNSSLPRISIKEPATLILHNVTKKYNGTYKFHLAALVGGDTSEVVVYIAVKPNVTVNCSSPLVVNEGDDVICECKCEDRNPSAECTWYRNGAQISRKVDVNTLKRRNISRKDSGSYTCVGQTHVKVRNEKSIKVTVYFRPKNTAIGFSTKSVEIGKSVTIMCSSDGFPEPRFTIFHNDSKLVGSEKTYTICKVKWDDAGAYKCFAKNELGSYSAFGNLTVKAATGLPTQQSTTRSVINKDITSPTSKLTTRVGSEKKASKDLESGITEWYIIVITLVSGIIIGVLLSYIVSYSRRKWCTRPEPTPEVQITAVDSTYQELDLTKMNKENNYQSLKGKAARNVGVNDDELNYTELNKTRDVESKYQSLT